MIFMVLLLFLSACEKDSGPLNPAGKIRTTKVDPPRSVRIEEGEGNSVDIRWSAPASDAGFSGRYNVQFKRRSKETYKFSYETEERTYNVNVIRDTTYDYRVRSLAAAGWEPSDWVATEYTLTGVAVENSAREAPANAAVAIPDEALRRYLERVLKKRRGATITHADMRKIVNLLEGHTTFQDTGGSLDFLLIESLVGLEAATNLQNVALGGNNISDVSPLANLSKLRYLDLRGNQISDVSPLAHLSKLRHLELKGNQISDLTPLAHLSALRHLDLRGNQISDLTPLAHLSELRYLDLRGNPLLSDASIDEHIPALQQRGVEVVFTPYRLFEDRGSPFDIELVFLDDFTEIEQKAWHQIAHRWEAAIQMDLPDYTFSARRNLLCGDHSISIPAGEQIDDLRIYITNFVDLYGQGGFGGPQISRRSSSMPIIGCVGIAVKSQGDFHGMWRTGLHEIGHVLGIGTTWDRMIRDLNGDTHFAGPQAIAAFDQAGGSDYQGAKVPIGRLSDDPYYRSHWRGSVVSGELMTSGGSSVLSAITLGALSDLGYTVDFSMADPYELPPPGAAKPVADAVPFCSLEVEGLPPTVYVDD